jgi:filamentous hemagglutinin family protein
MKAIAIPFSRWPVFTLIPIVGSVLPAIAQVPPITPATDGTGSVVTQQGDQFNITGGQLSGDGANLFHSFGQFGLGPGQGANFVTTPTITTILGRVVGGNASVINGLLQVTGGNSNLVLINPAGIIFGSTASLNLPAALTVTTADRVGLGNQWLNAIGPNDYVPLGGTPNAFAFLNAQPGAIANLGTLQLNPGQSLTLLGGSVLNAGTLSAPDGTITLAAVPGSQVVRLSQAGSLLSLEWQPIVDPTTPTIPPTAINSLPQLLTGGNLINASGITVNPNGTIRLTGSTVDLPTQTGTAIVAGTVDVSGQGAGNVNVLGDRVGVVNAVINATGNTSGGTVRIGGDYQGQGTVPNARSTYVSENSLIQADALTNGNGGTVTVWADDMTRFLGSITARGGSSGGNGGLVETSGKTTLDVATGRVDASAPQGTPGTWLLDPTDVTIGLAGIGALMGGVFDPPVTDPMFGAISPLTIETALNGGTNVTITTASGVGGNGDITLASNINQLGGGAASLTLTGRRFLNPGGQVINLSSTGNLTFNINQINPEAAPVATSIQNAVDAIGTVPGNRIINLGAGTYTLAATLNLDKSVTLNGNGPVNTTISGNNAVRVFEITGAGTAVTLNQLAIQAGNATVGGAGIRVNPGTSLNLTNSSVLDNQALGAIGGGGILNTNGTVAITNSNILRNTAQAEGGGIANNGTGILTIANSLIANNTAIEGGGIAINGGTVNVTGNTRIFNNSAQFGGGIATIIAGNPLTLTVTDSRIASNTASQSGGGIFHRDGTLSVVNSILDRNIAPNGSGITADGGSLSLANNSALIGGTTGLSVGGASSVSLGNTRFTGQTNYITIAPLSGLTREVDATAASFDGVTGATGSIDQLFAVSDKIVDGLDATGGGFVRLKANNVFVTPSSSIQAAVNVAAAGDTVNIAGGTYTEPAIENSKPLTFLTPGDLTLTTDILTTGDLRLTALGSLTLRNIEAPGRNIRLEGTTVTTGDLNTGQLRGDGGNIAIIARDRITTGFISTNSASNAGDVLLDPVGDIVVSAINATALSGGTGGNVTIITDRFFRATSSFIDPDRITASISASGGLGGGSISILTNRSGPITPFKIGDATTNGTTGAITTGLGNQLLPDRSIQGRFIQTQGNPPTTIEITAGISQASSPDSPTSSIGNVEPLQEIDSDIEEPPDFETPVDTQVSLDDSILNRMEAELTSEFTDYLDLPDEPPITSVPETQNLLNKVAQETGVKPALIYVNFAPQPTLSANAAQTKQGDKLELKNISQLELLVVTATGKPIVKRVGASRSEVLALAQEFRNEVADPSKTRTRSYLRSAQQLYNWLITPIAADLKAQGISNLAFIMDSGLRFIPLAALNDGQQFLIEQYSIGLMPTLSLTDTRIVDLQQAKVLGGGASQFAEQNPLPAVAVELAAIKQSWAGESLLNESFTRANLQQKRQATPFGIVHLSTHGEFLAGALSNSYIQLQGEKLRLDQIRQMGWNDPPLDLLVLSACRMALGDQDYHAELGFAGLAVQAGAKSAIASLWNVSDEGTAGLMAEFYQQLRQSPIKAEALRKSQLAMLKGTVRLQSGQLIWSAGTSPLPPEISRGDRGLSHPYYWAAFTLIGSPW